MQSSPLFMSVTGGHRGTGFDDRSFWLVDRERRMRFALGFVTGLISGFFLTMVIWDRTVMPYNASGHGVDALSAPWL